jgi:hypothetical protein
MLRKLKFLAVLVLVSTTAGGSYLAAQSMMSTATQGLYTTDADNYLDVNEWQEVVVDKGFAFLKAGAAEGVGAGAAFNLGPAFLGIGYAGKFWSGGSYFTEYDYGPNAYGAAYPPYAGNTFVDNMGYYVGSSDLGLTWTNRISILVGTGLLGGILADIDIAGAGSDNDDYDIANAAGVKVDTKNSINLGAIQAGLSWGRNFEVSDITIKPKLGFAYNFNRQKSEYRVSEPAASPTIRTLDGIDPLFSKSEFSAINNNVDPFSGGAVGLTGFLTANAGLSLNKSGSLGDGSVWLGYEVQHFAYDRQTTQSNGKYTDYSPAHIYHGFNLGLGVWYDLDEKLSLAWSVEVGAGIENAEINSGKTEAAGPENEFEYKEFRIEPSLSTGLAYKLIPDKLDLNAAFTISPLGYTNIKVSKTAAATNYTTSDTLNDISGISTVTSMGFTWLIAGELSLDAAMDAVTTSRLDIGSVSVLVSYKF